MTSNQVVKTLREVRLETLLKAIIEAVVIASDERDYQTLWKLVADAKKLVAE